MILSRNEVAATLQKAARGQGMPLGHADIFVAAAVRALAQGNCSSEVMVALQGPHLAPDFKKARVAMAGPVAIDAIACGENVVVLEHLDAPVILAAMIENANDNMALNIDFNVENHAVKLCVGGRPAWTSRQTGPLDIADSVWAIWQSWAAATYVPATAESRISGAGAGLTDND